MGMYLKRIDNFHLIVKNLENSLYFYSTVLGMQNHLVDKDHAILQFGRTKISLFEFGADFSPMPKNFFPGSYRFTLESGLTLDEIDLLFNRYGIEVLNGPVKAMGSRGEMMVYQVFDPDQNVIEIGQY